MFSKSVKIFLNTTDNQIGKVDLGFTDSGTLKFLGNTYEWQALNSSKVWLDTKKNVILFLDLENNVESWANVLISTDLEGQTTELLTLCGWYLLVVEWRAGLTNSILAGMPVKSEGYKTENKTISDSRFDKNWFDFLVDAIDIVTE